MIVKFTSAWELIPKNSVVTVDMEMGLYLATQKIVEILDITDTSGVCNGEEDAVLSDTVDLAHPGYFQPTLIDGTVKYMTVQGNICTRTITKDTCSLVRVKRIYQAGTTAAMGIVIYY